ncbi:MAG: TIGR03663 family protein [Candidatus Berkelbacteria bacterium]|nr:TIGR03663 family protein [Candidatus Berkelbacteria bacterium]
MKVSRKLKLKIKGLKEGRYLYFMVGAILVLAFLSRFILLADRPMHHDEGMLAYFAWKLSDFREYIYTPQIHAPILFYVQAIIYKIAKVTDYASRVGPAIFGLILISLPLFIFRKTQDKRGIFLAVLFLISPLFLYYSRFLVHTSMVVVFWFLLIYSLASFFRKPDPVPLYLSFIYLSLAFSTSETTYIFSGVVISSVLPMLLLSFKKTKKILKKAVDFVRANPLDLVAAILLFVVVWVAIYSVGFTNYRSLALSLPNPFDAETGLGFWLAQHPKKLGSQPWYYYLTLFIVYEPVVLLGAASGAIESVRKKNLFYIFLAWLALGALIGFSMAGEKFPWLALCSLLPLTVLAGVYFSGHWGGFSRGTKIILGILMMFTIFNAYRLSFMGSANTRELAVYVQTPASFKAVAAEINSNCPGDSNTCVQIDQQITWPLSWHFRNTSSLYYPEGLSVQNDAKYIFVSPDSADQVNIGEGWEKSTVVLRDWWVPERCRRLGCIGSFVKYFLFREIWNDKGGFDIYLYRRV